MTAKILHRNLLTDELYNYLKDQIVSHRLPAGEKLNVDKLARELDVSRVPIREVLARLAAEGLVQSVPFKGMFVSGMSERDIMEIFQIRMELEPLALRSAFDRIPPDLLQDIGGKEHDAATPFETIKRMNEDLHFLILRYAGNAHLERLVRSYLDQVHRYLYNVSYENNVSADKEEHQRIIDKILERDQDGAVQALRSHLALALERIREKLYNQGGR